MSKNTKTNVMRLLEQGGISYEPLRFDEIDVDTHPRVYKTLVTEGKSGENYVFMVPIDSELDLKKAAESVNEKSISMIREKELFPLTGYVHGGCSPIGMKKELPTTIDQSALFKETIIFSAGKKGVSVEVNSGEVMAFIPAHTRDIMKN